ncbi:MAG TPA: hypothetical protein VF774_04840 [Pseudoduganella sp.]
MAVDHRIRFRDGQLRGRFALLRFLRQDARTAARQVAILPGTPGRIVSAQASMLDGGAVRSIPEQRYMPCCDRAYALIKRRRQAAGQ